ncbi:hypothetical protein TNCV_1584191 [Trichonephila clavipes]|nr:hypothetical protein TNCV_1584191 [Trichonephila clavipes]
MLWEASFWSETLPLIKQRTPSSVPSTEEWDKLPQQLLDNVVQSMSYGAGVVHPSGQGIGLVSGHVMNSSTVPLKTRHIGGAMHVKSILELKLPPIGGVC